MSADRQDELVGSALREPHVPEHRPGFWVDLERALEAAPAHGAKPLRRRPSRGWTPRRRLLVAAAAAAATAAGIAIGLPRAGSPEPALADVVRERVATATAELETLSGRAFLRERDRSPFGGPVRTFLVDFALTGQGDVRTKFVRGRHLFYSARLAYDADRRVERTVDFAGRRAYGAEYTGVAPGPPDGHESNDLLQRHLGAAVRALLAASDPRVAVTTYRGRPAWTATLDVDPNVIVADFDHVVVTVDQELGLPVSVRTSFEGRFDSELRLRGLELNEPLPEGTFKLEFPPGAEVDSFDEGFRRVPLAEMEAIVGYRPLVPAEIPEGYVLTDFAVARRGDRTGSEGGNPRSLDVVSLTYRRGFDRFTVTTRDRLGVDRVTAKGLEGRGHSQVWSDPVAAGEGYFEEPEPVRLPGGAFAGQRADVVVSPRSIPHLWGVGDDLVFTVAGDLTANELVAVAASLEPR